MEEGSSAPSSHLEKLNEAQRRAVLYGLDGDLRATPPLLVIAGAGSGKTLTLAHRVAELIVRGADPRRVLLLTFSRRAAQEIVGLGADAVVITGGHLAGDMALDLLFDGRQFRSYAASRIETGGAHGTGCTFASALAVFLARGEPLAEAGGRAE